MDQLTLFPEDSRANHSPSPVEEEACQTTVISGRKCSGLLTKYGPLGLLAKMLLESSVWYNPVCRLTWEARPVLEKKIRKSLQSMSTSSGPFVRTLSESDIPSNHLLFQLVVQALPIGETGSGLLPTPTASYSTRHFQKSQKVILTKNGQRFRPDLHQLAAAGLLPTPTARDWKGPQARSYHQEKMDNLPGLVRFQLGKAGPLNPLFVGEMMGFPPNWLTSPFQNGGKNLCGPLEMR